MASLERYMVGEQAERLPTVRQQLRGAQSEQEAADQAQASLQKRHEWAAASVRPSLLTSTGA